MTKCPSLPPLAVSLLSSLAPPIKIYLTNQTISAPCRLSSGDVCWIHVAYFDSFFYDKRSQSLKRLPHIWMDVQFTAQASGLRRSPLVIVYSSVMTMYCVAKTPSSALFTPGLLGGERERREIAKWAMMGRKVCGRK